jgi:putative DNA primase/helicase
LIVLDVDGSEGEGSLRALEKRHGRLPVTVTVRTDRGRHLYFRHKGAVIPNSAAKLGRGLDVRGDGGYVVGARSNHPSGRYYEYEEGLSPEAVGIARIPEWFVGLTSRGLAKSSQVSPQRVPPKLRERAAAYANAAREQELERLGKAPKHQRNDTLNRCAFRLGQLAAWGLLDVSRIKEELAQVARQIGLDEAEIPPTILSGLTAGQSKPRRLPFSWKDLVRTAADKAPKPDDITAELANLGENDADNAQRFVKRWGDRVIWTSGRRWLVYQGGRWTPDASSEVNRLAEQAARAIALEAPYLDGKAYRSSRADFAAASLSRAAISNMLELAKPSLTAEDSSFDRDPWLLNVEDGTVDLRTGVRYRHDPRDLLTKVTRSGYSRKAECPQFLGFLRTIFRGDEDKIEFVQRVLGYGLTGHANEQVFFVLIGSGRNGKSTLLNLFRDIVGDYGCHTPIETLLVRQYDNAIPNDLARLVGKRIVTAAEANWNRQLDEAKLKTMTGGEPISARFMRQEYFQFAPEFKLFLAVNDFPRVRSTATAFWRRAVVIPFDVQVPEGEVDPNLSQKLKAEAPGILAWAVKGCLAWQRNGLKPPASVKDATGGWQQAVDHVDRFVREELTPEADHVIASSVMYARYKAWCAEKGESALSTAKFAGRLRDDLNITHKRTKKGSEWRGIKFRIK